MSADSPEEGIVGRLTDQPLFQFGDQTERFESVVHSLLLVVAAFVGSLLLVTPGDAALQAVGGVGPAVTEIIRTGLHFMGFILVCVLYLESRNDRSLINLGWPTKRDIGAAVVGSLLLIGSMLVADLLMTRFGVSPAENVAVERGRDTPEIFLYYIPLVLFVSVPAEELLFRGVIQGLFRRAYGIIPGILAASGIFGLIHYAALVGDGSALAYVAIAAASGIILGSLYEFSENILVPVAVHAAWNTLVYLNLYAESVGMI